MARQAIIIWVDGTQPGAIVKAKFPAGGGVNDPPVTPAADPAFASGSR
jgi:hypothetical protein